LFINLIFKGSFISDKTQLSTSDNSKFETLNFMSSISFTSEKSLNLEKRFVFFSFFFPVIVLKII
jgi:hypothetical protein